MLSVIYKPFMLFRYAECRYAECSYAACRYAECRYAECRYAECRSANQKSPNYLFDQITSPRTDCQKFAKSFVNTSPKLYEIFQKY